MSAVFTFVNICRQRVSLLLVEWRGYREVTAVSAPLCASVCVSATATLILMSTQSTVLLQNRVGAVCRANRSGLYTGIRYDSSTGISQARATERDAKSAS